MNNLKISRLTNENRQMNKNTSQFIKTAIKRKINNK